MEETIAKFVAQPYIDESDLLSKAVDKIERMGYRIDVLMSINSKHSAESPSLTPHTLLLKETILAFIKNVYEK